MALAVELVDGEPSRFAGTDMPDSIQQCRMETLGVSGIAEPRIVHVYRWAAVRMITARFQGQWTLGYRESLGSENLIPASASNVAVMVKLAGRPSVTKTASVSSSIGSPV